MNNLNLLILLILPLIGFSQATLNEEFTAESLTGNYNYETELTGNCSTPIVSSYPYSENFDALTPANGSFFSCITTDNLTDCWTNDTNNNNFWTARSIGTSSSNTGPGTDNTSGSGNYIFLESSACTNASILESPLFDLTTINDPFLEFYYHMYGMSTGSLEVHGSSDGTNWTQLWSLSGDQGDLWKMGEVSLTGFSGSPTFSLRFIGAVADFTSDMALDDFKVYSNPNTSSFDINTLSVFEIFPNPSSGSIKLVLETSKSIDLTLRVMSTLGQTIDQRTISQLNGSSNQEFDFNHLPKGIYFIELSDGNQSITKKLIIN